LPEDDPEDFAKFIEYCRRDVEAERQIHTKLGESFPLEGWALESFQLDLAMNDQGIPVNRPALEHASKLMEEYLAMQVPKFREQVATDGFLTLPITTIRKEIKQVAALDGFNPTQRELFMVWLANRGFTGIDLTADTVTEWLADPGDLSERGQAALHTYSLISSAAVKKIPAMLATACDDGFMRGLYTVFGAERTHRWTGRGPQPTNFARPRIKFTELAYDMICRGCSLDEIEDICGDFFDVLVSVIRHFIQPHEGNCLQADYSSIEARVAPWLVGEQATLDLFERGEPVYEIMAQKIFGGKVEDITPDQRFIGKQAVLGCTYNMGAPKFRGTCEGYGFSPSPEMVEEFKSRTPHQGVLPTEGEWIDEAYDDLAQRAVTAWRTANPITTASWKLLDTAAKNAIRTPKSVHKVGKLRVTYGTIGGFKALLIKLPSGHKLVYPRACIKPDGKFGPEIEFYGVVPNTGGQWGKCRTHGGKLFENCSQAAAGDVMRHGMKCAEEAGYEAFMLVHDEILTLQADFSQTHEELCDLLCVKADWMKGLPLAAEGGTLPFYKK
jgi:DNA polymerase